MNKLYKFSMRAGLWALPLFAATAQAQTPTVSYANWKNNAKAAYTMVHDDFGDPTTVGITNYADTIAFNRGIKFCFGAITSECDAADWADARRMMSHGHEVINHSHSHLCSYQPGWCTVGLYAPANFPVELDGSTTLIEQGAGERPRFFIHPFDLSTTQVLDRLRTLGYLGARSGTQATINNADFKDFFHLNFFVHDPTSNLTLLNQAVQTAVAAGGYAMRELHGVADGSWAPVSVADYRAHCNYVKQQIDANNIWSATASEAITYKIQRDAYTPTAVYNAAAKTVTVNFTGTATISPTLFKTPVTINVNLNGIALGGTLTVKQGAETLVAKATATQITVNAYPHKGAIVISAGTVGGCTTCPPPPPPPCTPDGKLKVETWTGLVLDNYILSDLTANPKYPNTPTKTELLAFNLFARGDMGDAYGEKISGYIVPPTTGDYIFGVTGDDDAELYLSTDDKPANKRKIAGFTGFTDGAQLTKYAGQKSAKITLQANKFYYIEMLHIATEGTTNACKAYWELPDATMLIPISKANFGSQTCAVSASALVTLNGVRTGQTTLLNWATEQIDENTPHTIERLEPNGRFSAIGTGANHGFADETPINGINIYRLRYTDNYGQTRITEPVKINFTENPNLYLAPNPAENVVSLDVREWNQSAITVSVYDARGALVQREQTTASDRPYLLDLSKIQQTGQYMIRVQSADGHSVTKSLSIAK